MGAITHNGEVLQRLPADAGQINFDNTGTNLNSTQVENAIKEVNTKVNTLQSEKADTDIVAADFNTGTSYTAGNYCIYDGKFYKFKANHSGAWSAADVDEIKIAGELSALKSGLTSVILADLPTLYATKCAGTVAVHFINTAFTPVSDDLSTLIGSSNKPSRNDISVLVVEVATGNVLILTYKTTGIVEMKSSQGVLIDHAAAVYGTLVFNA